MPCLITEKSEVTQYFINVFEFYGISVQVILANTKIQVQKYIKHKGQSNEHCDY